MVSSLLSKLNLTGTNPSIQLGVHRDFPDSNQSIIHSMNPTTQENLADVYTCGEAAVSMLITQADKEAYQWKSMPAPKRGEVIYHLAERLRKHKELLGTLISLEMGKSLQEGWGEVQEMIDIADFAVGQSRMLYGRTMHSERTFHRMYEQWHPYGIIGVITAFNFPMAVWAWNACIAAVCGNVTLWKPSEKTPLCAIAIQAICNEVISTLKIPSIFGYFMPTHHDVTGCLLDDKRVPVISFTGSTHTGRMVAERVTRRLGKVILELGGNNAVIVDETANLDKAIPAIVFGAIGTSGQRCTSTRRVFIHHTKFDEVTHRLIRAYSQVKIGDPLDSRMHMGPLIDEAALLKFQSTIDTIKQAGGEIIFGGNIIGGKGYFVQPTLVTKMKPNHSLVQQETFAPILYLFSVASIQEALEYQNAVTQGLSSALFTENLKHAELFLSAMGSDCGIANINIGTSGAEVGGAFGGEKDTGGGREAGSDAWKAYMRRQTNTINWSDALPLAQGIQFKLDT